MNSFHDGYFRPRSESDWELWRPLFTRLYKEENRPLPEVMQIMRQDNNFWARYVNHF
jgi:hypothetical protein